MLLVSLVSNNLSNYKRRHFKLFTTCHVSWDTLYLNFNTIVFKKNEKRNETRFNTLS